MTKTFKTGPFRMPEEKVPVFVRRLTGPLTLFAVIVAILFLLRAFHVMPPSGIPSWVALAIGVAGAVVLVRVLDYLLFDVLFRIRRHTAAPALLRQLVSLLLFGIAIALVVKAVFPDVQLGALLTTSAILTAVIGLALQDTLGNLFAGLALHLERTVRVGDLVRVGETFGMVEEFSWRAIKLRTTEGNVLLIPNSVAGRERLEIFPRPGAPIARWLRVGLEYDVSPSLARETLESALRGVPGIAAHPRRRAYLKSFEGYSILYELRYWLEDYSTWVETDSLVRERVWYALHRAGLQIPFPLIRQHQYAAGPVPTSEPGAVVDPAVHELDLFGPLSDADRARIVQGSVPRRYAPGEIIVREGDRSSSMFLIASGRVGVSLAGAGGDSKVVAELEAGTSFGEMSLLTGEPRAATVRALTETVLVEIQKETLQPILADNPSLCEAIERVIDERRQDAERAVAAERLAAMDAAGSRSPLSERIARFFGVRA
jgi:small-conductance mechanosensitive channel/CRP-like cAMP-binding protein